MTNLMTKVTVRKRPIKNGQASLYLDFYPAIRHPKTGRLTRREYLGIYIYTNPTQKFEVEYNKTMLQNAELIKCRRLESIINEEFGFLDRSKGKESFLEYFDKKKTADTSNWRIAYNHFCNYCKNGCTFRDLTVEFCQGFLDYLLNLETQNKKKMMASTANNNLNKLKCILRQAFEEGFIKENIARKLKLAKVQKTKKSFLSFDEVKAIADAPCGSDIVKRAGLFSCMTGLRISDIILLKWEDIMNAPDGGWCMNIITKKTKTLAVLPLSDEAYSICGDRTEGNVFKGLTEGLVRQHLSDWMKAAGITKHITFHCFRHTFATLQLVAGTDLYTVSKLLTHSDIKTTEDYAEVVSSMKREASTKISLK